MAEAPASSTSEEEDPPTPWKHSRRRSRKSGRSNIFTGVNLHQLYRLFTTAGDRDAEHRAKLVWRGLDADVEREEGGDEAGLAQALVGLRVRARNKAGLKTEGRRDHKWLRASGYVRVQESLSSITVVDEADTEPGQRGSLPATEEDVPERQNPFRPCSWRLDVAQQECARDSGRYLHNILH